MPHRATDKHRYDLGTRLLWLETGFHSLASGFPQHGVSPLRRGGHQHLHAEGNSHEPQLLRVGIPSILVGASIVRWGIRKTFGIGSALILVGALWLAVITSQPWHYWVGFGVLTATGISFGTIIPAATAVTRWFSRYRGRTMPVRL